MPPESNIIPPNSNSSQQPLVQPTTPPLAAVPPAAVPPISPMPAGPAMSSVPPPRRTKLGVMWVVCVMVIGLLVGVSYWAGTRKHAAVVTKTAQKTITIPKDATVTAECADMRGKQYIVPKNIPTGPVYDVYQGKVVAVEYLVGQTELANKSDVFANLAVPQADYNHLTVMPMAPHAGENELHFHVIMYLISNAAAQKITCTTSPDQMTGSM